MSHEEKFPSPHDGNSLLSFIEFNGPFNGKLRHLQQVELIDTSRTVGYSRVYVTVSLDGSSSRCRRLSAFQIPENQLSIYFFRRLLLT